MLLKDYTPSHLLTFFSGSCGRRKLIPGSLPTENMPVRMVETPKLPERKPPVKRKREREREPPQYIMHRPMAGYQYFFIQEIMYGLQSSSAKHMAAKNEDCIVSPGFYLPKHHSSW